MGLNRFANFLACPEQEARSQRCFGNPITVSALRSISSWCASTEEISRAHPAQTLHRSRTHPRVTDVGLSVPTNLQRRRFAAQPAWC